MLEITLLTKAECEFCDRAKEILERLAGDIALNIDVVEFESPRGRRLAQDHGILFAPGIFIDGRLATYGRPSERRLRRDLQASARR